MQRLTIYDVAKAAGVSHQTVSRVLNDKPDVAAETRRRVLSKIAEMGYVPQAAARRLGSGDNRVLALLMRVLSHPYWPRLIDGMQAYCSSKRLGLMVGSSHFNLAEARRQIEIFREHGAGGIALSPCFQSEILAEAPCYDMPVVLVGEVRSSELDVARVDDEGGTRALTELLIERGHRRVALINSPAYAWQTAGRYAGYCAALRGAGIAVDESLVKSAEFDAEASREATAQLLDMPDPPTALVATSPALARGMLELIRARSLRMPDDIAVAAYTDGVTLSEEVTYATCEPIEDLGRRAAEMLLDRIEGYDGPPREYILGFQVHIGASSG